MSQPRFDFSSLDRECAPNHHMIYSYLYYQDHRWDSISDLPRTLQTPGAFSVNPLPRFCCKFLISNHLVASATFLEGLSCRELVPQNIHSAGVGERYGDGDVPQPCPYGTCSPWVWVEAGTATESHSCSASSSLALLSLPANPRPSVFSWHFLSKSIVHKSMSQGATFQIRQAAQWWNIFLEHILLGLIHDLLFSVSIPLLFNFSVPLVVN